MNQQEAERVAMAAIRDSLARSLRMVGLDAEAASCETAEDPRSAAAAADAAANEAWKRMYREEVPYPHHLYTTAYTASCTAYYAMLAAERNPGGSARLSRNARTFAEQVIERASEKKGHAK